MNPCRRLSLTSGSSPHTRGTRRSPSSGPCAAGDHPRIRGEHDPKGTLLKDAGGSSPHTRGTPYVSPCSLLFARDHPRIRGEHGSRCRHQRPAAGIIPAYAGNTEIPGLSAVINSGSSPHTRGTRQSCHYQDCRYWDHPRIRGEHTSITNIAIKSLGIIPAYAGNTSHVILTARSSRGSSPHTRGTRWRCRSCPSRSWDHPCIRGEHAPAQRGYPHFRGIIPAYAGNTWSVRPSMLASSGSSPHTRGTP